jgi:hypothetical protein
VITPTALFGVAIAAWGYPMAPPPSAPPAPAAVASPVAPAFVPDAAAGPTEEGPERAAAPSVETSPVPGPIPSPTTSAEIVLPAPAGKKKHKKRDAHNGAGVDGEETGRFGTVELKGRIFVLGELLRTNVTVFDTSGLTTTERDSFDITVTSVRPALHWQAPQKWLSAVIEVEVTQKPDMRDGYVQAKRKDFMLRAGQFKMPGSAIELASPWALPFVRRGFLHGLLVDGLDNAWRRPGVMLRWRGADFLRPEISAGVFQGFVVVSETPERDKDLIVAQSLSAQSLIGRAQIEPVDGIQIGGYYHHRVGTPTILRTARYWTAGADLVVDRTFANGGLRIWLDGIAGASWFEHPSKPPDGQDTTFVAGRSILAWRFGGVEAEQRYLEAFGTFGVLDPDTEVVADLAVEAAVGFNLGLWQRLRITAQGEIWRVGRNFPPGYTVGIDPDRVAALLQVGVNL